MTKKAREILSDFVKKMPSTKVLLAITAAIIVGLIVYIIILFLSRS